MAIIHHDDLSSIREEHRGKTIVLCTGTFDLTHAGHALFFEDCKGLGDFLVVGVGNDAAIRNLKGQERPVFNEHVRLKLISSLKPVDYCFLDPTPPGDQPLNGVELAFAKLRPDLYVINSDAFNIPYRRMLVEKYGVRLAVLERRSPPEFEEISTTKIIEKIKRSALGGRGDSA